MSVINSVTKRRDALRVDALGRLLVQSQFDPVYIGPLSECPNPSEIPGLWVRITDMCQCPILMYSDGNILTPDNGEFLLASASGSRAAPVASAVGNGAIQLFSTPNIVIPAYFIGSSCKSVQIEAFFERSTVGTGSVGVQVRLGNADSTSDPVVGAGSCTATAGMVARVDCTVEWSDNNNGWASGAVSRGGTGGPAAYSDFSSGVNTYADLHVNFGFNASALAADTMKLLAYRVWLSA